MQRFVPLFTGKGASQQTRFRARSSNACGIDAVSGWYSTAGYDVSRFGSHGLRSVETGRVQPDKFFTEEFDPGSERTLAAGLRHASRARKPQGEYSGVRVSNR